MAIRDIFKISWKTFLNPLGWVDWSYLKFQNQTMYNVLRNMFTPDKPIREESFEDAMKRLGLSEEELQIRIKNFRYIAIMFVILGFILFFYTFYLLFRYSTLTGFLLGLTASGLFFSQAFRYDFWAFQMQRRKLGASFQQWKNHVLGVKRGKHS